jgi:hypothetical protein
VAKAFDILDLSASAGFSLLTGSLSTTSLVAKNLLGTAGPITPFSFVLLFEIPREGTLDSHGAKSNGRSYDPTVSMAKK